MSNHIYYNEVKSYSIQAMARQLFELYGIKGVFFLLLFSLSHSWCHSSIISCIWNRRTSCQTLFSYKQGPSKTLIKEQSNTSYNWVTSRWSTRLQRWLALQPYLHLVLSSPTFTTSICTTVQSAENWPPWLAKLKSGIMISVLHHLPRKLAFGALHCMLQTNNHAECCT